MMERNVMSVAQHHNVVRLYFTFQTKEELFFVMSLCASGDLFQVIQQFRERPSPVLGAATPVPSWLDEPLPSGIPGRLVQFYIAQAVEGLKYLHTKLRVVHRDLKPENVLLDDEGHCKIADFGSARSLSDEEAGGPPEAGSGQVRVPSPPQSKHALDSTEFCGTAEYVSPEVLADQPAYGPADLWALGCMLYQMVAGKLPFRGDNDF